MKRILFVLAVFTFLAGVVAVSAAEARPPCGKGWNRDCIPPTTTVPTTTVPPPTSTPPTAPTGSTAPFGDLPGWRQVYVQDFNVDTPLGSWGQGGTGNPPAAYQDGWMSVYPDGWADTSGKCCGTPSIYKPSRVVSTSGGILDKWLHTENGQKLSATVGVGHGQSSGRFSVRFRADEVHGWKTAWLLWPTSEVWPRDGEIDFPEGDLDATISGFVHHQGATAGNDQDGFGSSYRYGPWHVATVEWIAGQRVTFLLDGQVIGTTTTRIPNTPMRWVLQTESGFGDQPVPGVEAHLQVDWVTVYTPT